MFYICGKYKNRFLMKTVKLITCNDAMKAHILQGALENEGIESILHNENFSTLYKSCVSSIAEWTFWWRMMIMRKPFRC